MPTKLDRDRTLPRSAIAPAKRKVSAKSAAKSATPPDAVDAMPPVAKGQKWRIPRGHAEVLHVGKSLVQYRFIKTGMVRGSLEMKSIANFAEALKTHKAELVA